MTFIEKLRKRQMSVNSMLCVGLDHDRSEESAATFNKMIIKNTAEFVCAYKLNTAFYSRSGWLQAALEGTIDYLRENYPEIPIILDTKRGDVAASASGYVDEAFVRFKAEAVTINPYLGKDSCQPFLDQKDKGIFVLCKTSNPGSGDFQDLPVHVVHQIRPLWEYVAFRVIKSWNKNNNCGLVVGATYPKELLTVRKMAGDMPILVPGTGAQGGDLAKVVRCGLDSTGFGLIISVSRSIMYASIGFDFAEAARRETANLRDRINALKTSLGGAFAQPS